MSEDAVTWTQVSILAVALVLFLAIGKLNKKVAALEGRAGEKAGAASGDS